MQQKCQIAERGALQGKIYDLARFGMCELSNLSWALEQPYRVWCFLVGCLFFGCLFVFQPVLHWNCHLLSALRLPVCLLLTNIRLWQLLYLCTKAATTSILCSQPLSAVSYGPLSIQPEGTHGGTDIKNSDIISKKSFPLMLFPSCCLEDAWLL